MLVLLLFLGSSRISGQVPAGVQWWMNLAPGGLRTLTGARGLLILLIHWLTRSARD